MKTKYFIMIAAAMLLTLASLATQAQDVYEYATVFSYTKICTSYSNGKYEEIELEKGSKGNVQVLQLTAKLSEEGWEIINSSAEGQTAWRFFLKRKVK